MDTLAYNLFPKAHCLFIFYFIFRVVSSSQKKKKRVEGTEIAHIPLSLHTHSLPYYQLLHQTVRLLQLRNLH